MKRMGLLFLLMASFTSAVNATLLFDQNVTPDVIFGSGNDNGGFTLNSQNGIELGLRAKLRFDDTNQPANIFNSNGAGSYLFDNTAPPSGFGFAPNSPSTAIWNFEWSINSNVDGSGSVLDSLFYTLSIDFDPSLSTQFLTFDPVNQTFADHAIGNNGTGNGNGTVAADAASYGALIGANNVAQNSWNMDFFDGGPFTFTNTDNGVYDFVLSAFDAQGVQLASTSIQVITGDGAVEVPTPASLLLLLSGLGVLRLNRRKL